MAEVHTCGAKLTSPPEPWCAAQSSHTTGDQRAAMDDDVVEVCASCGRMAQSPAGPGCEDVTWHAAPWSDEDADPVKHEERSTAVHAMEVARALHLSYCQGPHCSYGVRDLQVALDAIVAVRREASA